MAQHLTQHSKVVGLFAVGSNCRNFGIGMYWYVLVCIGIYGLAGTVWVCMVYVFMYLYALFRIDMPVFGVYIYIYMHWYVWICIDTY